MTNKKALISILIILTIGVVSFIVYDSTSKQATENKSVQYDTSFIADESIVYLGKETAKNEILFIFDYSCIWCNRWMDEIFPQVQQLINEEQVKFRTQSMVFLNAASLQLSKLDQNVKVDHPDKYFDVFLQITNDAHGEDLEELLANQYIDELITRHHLDEDVILREPQIDVINLTRKYTNGLNIESVPTILVNGEIVDEPFDIQAIKALLK